MWGEPRKGTEAYAVKEEVAKKKKAAKDKKLDTIFSTAYHESIHAYPAWIRNQNKKSVHPEITEARAIKKDYKKEKESQNLEAVEFIMGGKHYRITEEEKNGYDYEDRYMDLVLYLNNKKIFAISEKIHYEEWGTEYIPFAIDAYINEEWVEDFKKINDHRVKMQKQFEIEFAENPQRTKSLKEDFGITELPIETSESGFSQPTEIVSNHESIWKKWWVWALIIYLLYLWLS